MGLPWCLHQKVQAQGREHIIVNNSWLVEHSRLAQYRRVREKPPLLEDHPHRAPRFIVIHRRPNRESESNRVYGTEGQPHGEGVAMMFTNWKGQLLKKVGESILAKRSGLVRWRMGKEIALAWQTPPPNIINHPQWYGGTTVPRATYSECCVRMDILRDRTKVDSRNETRNRKELSS